jgi:glucose dehydrogenase
MTISGRCVAPHRDKGNFATARDLAPIGLKHLGLARVLAGTAVASCLGLAAVPAPAAEVTYQRLINASSEPQNWLMRMGNYANWNHSALNTINRGNVVNLKVKFMASLGDPSRPNKAT